MRRRDVPMGRSSANMQRKDAPLEKSSAKNWRNLTRCTDVWEVSGGRLAVEGVAMKFLTALKVRSIIFSLDVAAAPIQAVAWQQCNVSGKLCYHPLLFHSIFPHSSVLWTACWVDHSDKWMMLIIIQEWSISSTN